MMKQMRYTKTAICIGMIICLAACQNEGLDRKKGSLRVSAFAYEGQVVSRAADGYTDFANTYGATSSTPVVMPFWAVSGANSFNFEALYNGTGWSSYCHLEPGTYNFYSYLPKSITADGVDVTFTNGSPATLTFGNVPAVLGKDLLVSVATTSGDSSTDNPYDQKIDGSEQQPLTFRMDHVLAKLTFSFTNPTGKSFSDLRRIVIKAVEVKTDWSPRWNIVCTMGNSLSYQITEGSGSPVPHTIENNSSQTINEKSVSGYLVEQKAYNESASTPFGSCYLVPNNGYQVAIRATYDVYDKNGTLIRAGEKAVNNSLVITRKNTSGNYNPIEAGTEYKVNVQVIPDYLYVLGDDDAGNALQIGS